MPRLPQPGSDQGTWGQILNDYLAQAHLSDGTLKNNVVDESNLTPAVVAKLNAVAGPQGATGAVGATGVAGPAGATGSQGSQGQVGATGVQGIPGATGGIGSTGPAGATGPAGPTGVTGNQGVQGATGVQGVPGATGIQGQVGATGAVGPGASDATSSTKGIVQLTGDLGGTAASPTVPGLASKANAATSVTGTNSLTGGGNLSADRTIALVNDSASPGNQYYYGTNNVGTKGYFSLPVGGGSQVPTSVLQIDDFAGATDDAKHVAAWAAAASASRKPILQYPARTFGPLSTPITAFSGMRAIGPDGTGGEGPKNQEIGGGNFVPHRVQVNCGTGTSALFVQSAVLQEVIFANISWSGSTSSQWWHNTNGSSYSIYPGQFHSLSFDGFNSVLGNTAQKFTVTQFVFSGHWTVLNYQNTPLHIGGSDNSLWMTGYLNSNSPASVAGAGKPILHLDYLEKSNVGYVYITAENGWSGLRIEGPIERAIRFFGGVFEGRSAGNPATYPVIDIRGCHTTFYGPDLGYVVNTNANGAIVQSGGVTEISVPHYRKATSAAATFPMFYQTGGIASITRPLSPDGNAVRVRWKDAALGTQDENIPYPTGNSRDLW